MCLPRSTTHDIPKWLVLALESGLRPSSFAATGVLVGVRSLPFQASTVTTYAQHVPEARRRVCLSMDHDLWVGLVNVRRCRSRCLQRSAPFALTLASWCLSMEAAVLQSWCVCGFGSISRYAQSSEFWAACTSTRNCCCLRYRRYPREGKHAVEWRYDRGMT
jgi:hypothetical protein